jgi:hypothetical protein
MRCAATRGWPRAAPGTPRIWPPKLTPPNRLRVTFLNFYTFQSMFFNRKLYFFTPCFVICEHPFSRKLSRLPYLVKFVPILTPFKLLHSSAGHCHLTWYFFLDIFYAPSDFRS